MTETTTPIPDPSRCDSPVLSFGCRDVGDKACRQAPLIYTIVRALVVQ